MFKTFWKVNLLMKVPTKIQISKTFWKGDYLIKISSKKSNELYYLEG